MTLPPPAKSHDIVAANARRRPAGTVARVVGKGLAGFIQKPFAFEELQQRLRALLR